MDALFDGLEGLSLDEMLEQARADAELEQELEQAAVLADAKKLDEKKKFIVEQIRGQLPEALREYLNWGEFHIDKYSEGSSYDCSLNLVFPDMAIIRIYLRQDWRQYSDKNEVYITYDRRYPGPFSVIGYGIREDGDTGEAYVVERREQFEEFGAALIRAKELGYRFDEFQAEVDYLNSKPKVTYETVDGMVHASAADDLYCLIRRVVKEIVMEVGDGRSTHASEDGA